MSGEAQNVGVAPLCALGLRVESARRRRVSGVGGGSDGRHARLWRRRGRAGRLCTSHSPSVSRGSPRTSRSPSPYGTKRRCKSGPSNCGRRRRPFALVSCRFGVEIGARSVTWSHPNAPAAPLEGGVGSAVHAPLLFYYLRPLRPFFPLPLPFALPSPAPPPPPPPPPAPSARTFAGLSLNASPPSSLTV